MLGTFLRFGRSGEILGILQHQFFGSACRVTDGIRFVFTALRACALKMRGLFFGARGLFSLGCQKFCALCLAAQDFKLIRIECFQRRIRLFIQPDAHG